MTLKPLQNYNYILLPVISEDNGDKIIIDFKKKQFYTFHQNSNSYTTYHLPGLTKAFISIDPKALEFTDNSPYIYCLSNPILYEDPDGERPIYSDSGSFLGTDFEGIDGFPIIMSESNFTQGMPTADALSYQINPSDLSTESLIKVIVDYFSLPSRPDYDGYISLGEANDWYRNGEGRTLYADINKIYIPPINWNKEKNTNETKVINLLTSGIISEGLVYGNVTFYRNPDNTIGAATDRYDFDIKPNNGIKTVLRNVETVIGSVVAGKGMPYNIIFYGKAKAK